MDAALDAGAAGLVHAAGAARLGSFVDNEAMGERSVVDVGVTATVELCRSLVPPMIAAARAGGQRAMFITVASTAAFVPVPRFAVYAASKAFVLSLTEAIAAELSDEPIDVLCTCPGATRTAFGHRAGFARSHLPGAMSPDTVADRALRQLGCATVAFTDRPSRLALTSLVKARRTLARGLDSAIGLAQRA
ncbi:MAG: SDR family NAD(P)-dependent oxidoreductase [Pseudomonadota bacterium]